MLDRLALMLSLILFCGLVSCGNTGDLYLPDNSAPIEDTES